MDETAETSSEPPAFDAILLVSFGGPEGVDEVIPFLENVLRGRNVPRERMLEVAEHYYQFGGVSPINRQNRELIACLENELAEHEIAVEDAGDYGWWKAVNDLFEELVEPELRGPVFVYDYPAAICPLAKPSAEDPVWAERFEFFLGGMELANAFSELNDPQLQLAKFEEQVADKDPEAPNAVDHDYVRALAYGLPPAGGCGVGIDRLVMVLLGCDSIREVLLFPHLRPEAAAGEATEPEADGAAAEA